MAEDFYIVERTGRKFLYVQFRDPRTGILSAARSSGRSSRGAAALWAQKEYQKIQSLAGRAEMTLGEWAAPFFTATCPRTSRRRDEGATYSELYLRTSRIYLTKHIIADPIAQVPLEKLTRRDVLAWRRRLVENIGACRSAVHILGVLKVILAEAVYQELLEYSPAAQVAPPAYKKETREALSLEALRKVLEPSRYAEPRHWLASFTAAATGMRAAEIRALTWQAIDFQNHRIVVFQAFKDQQHRLGPPKNGRTRVVPLAATLERLLKEWEGRWTDADRPEWVFGYSKMRPLGYKDWSAAFKAAANGAGCTGATLHVLRHTLNTQLRGEIDDVRLQASFGWSGAAIQDNYTHAATMDYAGQALAIDRVIGPAPKMPANQ